jgi:prevent-host-death family protein
MTTVGSFEAKTHLPALLERVAQGEHIVITKRGKPMAMLVPPAQTAKPKDVRHLVKEMLALRDKQGPKVGPNLTIRQLVEEGRRF